MKKFTVCCISLLLTISLAACGKEASESSSSSDTPVATETMVLETESETEATLDDEVSFEPVVIADTDEFTIRADSFEQVLETNTYDGNPMRISTFTFYLENKSDRPLEFSLDEDRTAINDIMYGEWLNEDLEPGTNMTATVQIPESKSIHYVETMEAVFKVYDSTEYILDAPFTLNVEHTTSEPSTDLSVATEGFEPQVWADTDDITITAYRWGSNYFGYSIYVQAINKSDKDIHLTTKNATVNGVECFEYGSADIMAGKIDYVEFYWKEEDLSKNGIKPDEITNISNVVYTTLYNDPALEPISEFPVEFDVTNN